MKFLASETIDKLLLVLRVVVLNDVSDGPESIGVGVGSVWIDVMEGGWRLGVTVRGRKVNSKGTV